MGRKTETDEQKVLKVHSGARCVRWDIENYITYYTINDEFGNLISSKNCDTYAAAWSDALRQINADKRKKYYKRKITRPNNEIKAKVTIMLYPSHQRAAIEQYGSVQKFINTIVEQLKLAKNEVDKN